MHKSCIRTTMHRLCPRCSSVTYNELFSTPRALAETRLPTLGAMTCAFAGPYRQFDKVLKPMGIETTFLDLRDLARVEAAFRPETKLLWLESPSNPTLEVFDITALAKVARARGIRCVSTTPSRPSFGLAGGLEESRRFLSALRIFALAESLGGVESLAEHPAIMTHSSIPREQRESGGVSDSLVRLSVGLKAVEDLWADVESALQASS